MHLIGICIFSLLMQNRILKTHQQEGAPFEELFSDKIRAVPKNKGGVRMLESAQGHFVNISDPLVQCMVYEINEKPFCLIDVIGFGVFRARLLRDDESIKNLRYQNYLVMEDKLYLLLNQVPPD